MMGGTRRRKRREICILYSCVGTSRPVIGVAFLYQIESIVNCYLQMFVSIAFKSIFQKGQS